MAVLPEKNSGVSKQSSSGARFRQRKISVKQPLTIYKQKELPALDSSNELEPSQIHHLSTSSQQQRDLHSIDTGVDKNEEDEVHLQQVINAAQKALLSSKLNDSKKELENKESVYIPTPDASRIWPEASKYYSDQTFKEPESYIKFSATVEDTVGIEYNIDEIDEQFLNNKLNKRQSKNSNEPKCTELEFELICDKYEKTIEEKQPFLSMGPTNILSYKELSSIILEEIKGTNNEVTPYTLAGSTVKYISTSSLKNKLSKELNYEPFTTLFDKDTNGSDSSSTRPLPKLLELFGEAIYEHWKERKINRRGKQIHPSLKFEDPNANEKDNDNDPYICFRRREFRQARKTRRADTIGAERIRLLQKSMQKARELVLLTCKRELLKMQNWETETDIFKLRCESKNLKRTLGVKGDDHLFYPHKRKKVIKIKEDEDDSVKSRRIEKRKNELRESSGISNMPGTATIGTNAVHKDKSQLQQLQEQSNSTQPYVKLPASKIPDMDLVTVSLVLREKNETIKRAVLEKLRKRKEQDNGFINVTDNPFQPYFNISTNENCKELSHIPYSSIASSNFHEFNTTNYISESLKKLLEENKPLPGMKTFCGSNGELIPSKPFPFLLSLLEGQAEKSKYNSVSYISQLLSNIESNNFSAYSKGYGSQQNLDSLDSSGKLSDPIFRLRKRIGRANRVFLDRRSLHKRPDDDINEFLKFDNSEELKEGEKSKNTNDNIPNIYESKADTIKRLDSNWKFDDDLTEYERGIQKPFSLDPSRLNCISDDTQSIRFGSMLLAKSYDLLRESVHQKQQAYIQQARMRALQQQQLANKQQSNDSNSTNSKQAVASNQISTTGNMNLSAQNRARLSVQGSTGGSDNSPLLASQTHGSSQNIKANIYPSQSLNATNEPGISQVYTNKAVVGGESRKV